MPEFRFLTPDDYPLLYDCFLAAFASYYVPMQPPMPDFSRRLERMGVSLGWSGGVFEGDRLLGFILTGIGEYQGYQTAYNAGTGIRPAHRRNGLMQGLYRWLIHQLQAELAVEQFVLEVIEKNQAGLRLYEKLHFRVSRFLCSYQFSRTAFGRPKARERVQIQNQEPDWDAYLPLRAFAPYWGNDFPALTRGVRLRDCCLEYRDEQGALKGFLLGEVSTGKIALWGGDIETDIPKELFKNFAWLSPASTLSVLNVPASDEEWRQQLKQWGGRNYLNQYEMRLFVG
ncbi:MAG: GNAT family N-acetyltransferase [Bernardetiaceae bacterium]